jgi:hypothetical protein
MVSAPAGVAVAPLIAFHSLRRREPTPAGIWVTADGRCFLPGENRSNCALSPDSRAGPGWLQLSFGGLPEQSLLLLRDQVDAGAWRVLRIAILESR